MNLYNMLNMLKRLVKNRFRSENKNTIRHLRREVKGLLGRKEVKNHNFTYFLWSKLPLLVKECELFTQCRVTTCTAHKELILDRSANNAATPVSFWSIHLPSILFLKVARMCITLLPFQLNYSSHSAHQIGPGYYSTVRETFLEQYDRKNSSPSTRNFRGFFVFLAGPAVY